MLISPIIIPHGEKYVYNFIKKNTNLPKIKTYSPFVFQKNIVQYNYPIIIRSFGTDFLKESFSRLKS